MEKEMAKFILIIISKAIMPADDQTQANITACKQWLGAIATGQLEVKSAKVKRAKPATT